MALNGIVEDHTDGMPMARVELTGAVVQLYLIVAAYSLHRAAVDRARREASAVGTPMSS
jgi:hypothetical protein